MKKALTLTGCIMLLMLSIDHAKAQADSVLKKQSTPDTALSVSPSDADTVILRGKDGRSRRVTITIGSDGEPDTVTVRRGRSVRIESGNETVRVPRKKSKVIWGITFARFDVGFATLIDNGSFTLSPENRFLRNRTWKTSNLGFDVAQFGYRFDESFRMFLSAGFDWTYIRLRENVIFTPGAPVLDPVDAGVGLSKNRLTSAYIRLPLTFENSFGEDRNFKVAYGPIGGFLLHGSQRYRTPDGRVKVREEFNFAKFRYGGFVRFGYRSFGLYAKYYANDMFESSPQQEGLKNLSIGAMLFF